MRALTNATFFTGEEWLDRHALLVKGATLGAFVAPAAVPAQAEIIDCHGARVVPGFVDLQVNGGGGVLLNDDAGQQSLLTVFAAHLKFGTTALLPTVFTTSAERMQQLADSVSALRRSGHSGIAGAHFEGPYLSSAKPGVHQIDLIRATSNQELEVIRSVLPAPVMLTVAPECVPSRLIAELVGAGVIVSAGHSACAYQQAMAARAAGLSCVTHLHNAMSPMQAREPGLTGFALGTEDVWAGIIMDGQHVHFATARTSWLAKRHHRGKLFLVTDAMPPVGTNLTSFDLNGSEVRVSAGRCETADGTLAGSVLDMASAVRNAISGAGVPLDEALRMASTYPAALLRLDHTMGRLRQGCLANLVLLDQEMVVTRVMRNGQWCDG